MNDILYFVSISIIIGRKCDPPCLNGGQCIPAGLQEVCKCPESYSGTQCENGKLQQLRGLIAWYFNISSGGIKILITSRTYYSKKLLKLVDPVVTCEAKSKTSLGVTSTKGEGRNGKCMFPFYYGGLKHEYCAGIPSYGGVGWCSFTTYYAYRWGYCTSSCPKGK